MKPSSIKDGIHNALDQLIKEHYPKFHIKNLLKDLSESLWSWKKGICQDALWTNRKGI